jgi:hypothetical protein
MRASSTAPGTSCSRNGATNEPHATVAPPAPRPKHLPRMRFLAPPPGEQAQLASKPGTHGLGSWPRGPETPLDASRRPPAWQSLAKRVLAGPRRSCKRSYRPREPDEHATRRHSAWPAIGGTHGDRRAHAAARPGHPTAEDAPRRVILIPQASDSREGQVSTSHRDRARIGFSGGTASWWTSGGWPFVVPRSVGRASEHGAQTLQGVAFSLQGGRCSVWPSFPFAHGWV